MGSEAAPYAERLQHFAVRQLYAVGWRLAAGLPADLVDLLIGRAATRVVDRGGRHVQNLRANLSALLSAPASDDLVLAAMRSHFRNVYEQLALPGWPVGEMLGRVRTTGEPELRAAMAGPGAVLALPHSGNWDLAGAWACRSGFPVTTVAERLGDREYAAFVRFRTELGMEVWSHTNPRATRAMIDAVGRGRVVCLLADRDLHGSGVAVRWGDRETTMPVGPALVARRSGATLMPVVSQFTPTGMVLHIGPAVETRSGATGLRVMTQDVADVFTRRIRERPEDWHMLQPFFAPVPGSAA